MDKQKQSQKILIAIYETSKFNINMIFYVKVMICQFFVTYVFRLLTIQLLIHLHTKYDINILLGIRVIQNEKKRVINFIMLLL